AWGEAPEFEITEPTIMGEAPELMRSLNRQLWKKSVHIAQPYFYPMTRGGGWMTLLLIVMLLVLVFALLLVGVTAVTLVGQYLNPPLTEEVAPGLASMLSGLLSSPRALLGLPSLVLPLCCLFAVRRYVLTS